MFEPTHLLVSRSRQTPVQLVHSAKGFFLLTESEWQNHSHPTFEMHPKLGFFCHGIPVVGYSLQLLEIEESVALPVPAAISA